MNVFSFDFTTLLSFDVLFAVVFGTLFGIFIGVLPGVGSTIGIVLLLPLTYSMSPIMSIIMLMALYNGGSYGGSISSIILGVPGTPGATATAIDGYPLAKKGFPGKALGYSLTASTIGGIFGALCLMFLTLTLSTVTRNFRDPEFFLLGLLGLVCVASLSSKDVVKSSVSIFMGLQFSLVGMDIFTGAKRFTFGNINLLDGFTLVSLLIGLFAVSEALNMLEGDLSKRHVTEKKRLKTSISWEEFKSVVKDIFKSSVIGTSIGILPGMGGSPASWFSLTEAQRSSKTPEKFGTGHPNGIAAPEAANNACVGGSMVPLLTLGIPGSPAAAVIMGALMIHGVQMGPMLMDTETELIFGIFWGFLFAVISMYIFGRYLTTLFARMLTLPQYIMVPSVAFIALIGTYVPRLNIFDLWVAIIVGGIAYILRKLDFSLPSFVLAFILGPIMERGLRRSLMISRGSWSIFVTRPYCIFIIVLIVLLIIAMVFSKAKTRKAIKEKIDAE